MSRYVFDTETNGFLDVVTNCWIVRVINIDTGEKIRWLEGDFGWKKVFDEATLLVGHNIIGYDLPVLEKLFDYKPKKHTVLHDTMIMSLVLDYNRDGGHSLDAWGQKLGYHKIHFDKFDAYSEEMDVYCERDVDLNLKVYRALLQEFSPLMARSPQIKIYMRVEHAVARWCAMANLHGWPFNVEAARELLVTLEANVENTRSIIQPLLGLKTVAVDKVKGVVEVKSPKWVKNGGYAAHTANWFDIMWESGQDEDRLVEGDYCRVEFVELDLDSVADVKIFLFRNNWKPTEWNFKFNETTKRKERTSPKITEDSLEALQGHGKIYCDFLTNKSRRDILKGWLNNVDEKGLLHGECFTIGTPSLRARHSIIVNVPAADSVWGPEMRKLFGCLPGWKLIGCDSAGNQARGLAHYLKSPEYVELLLNGDIHQYNADVLTSVLKKLGINHTVPRANAKRVLYAFLFGAAGDKIMTYIPGIVAHFDTPGLGNKIKNGFARAVPGLETLLEKLESIFSKTKQYGPGYITGLAGNRIYCDSYHKLLVYLLQAAEKATCGAAVMLTMERLEAEGIPYIPCIMMHDELDMMVPEEFAEKAAAISKQTFTDGPLLFGVTIMSGESKIGNNWMEVH